jgi:alpha/beta superfamily hydrolase
VTRTRQTGSGQWCTISSTDLFSFHHDSVSPRSNVVLIIPGLGQHAGNAGYAEIGKIYRSRGIASVHVNIRWRRVGYSKLATVAEAIALAAKEIFPDSQVYLAGFSLGAAIACNVSHWLPARHILLCSMSAIFSEDRPLLGFPFRQVMQFIVRFTHTEFSYRENCSRCIDFLYGDHDNASLNGAIIRHRSEAFHCSTTAIIKNARHAVAGREYLAAIGERVLGIRS